MHACGADNHMIYSWRHQSVLDPIKAIYFPLVHIVCAHLGHTWWEIQYEQPFLCLVYWALYVITIDNDVKATIYYIITLMQHSIYFIEV